MYAKLVLKNAKRSAKDYLVYIVTMTICVTLFYSFLSISSSYYQPDIGSEYDFTILSDGMKMAICAITLFLLFLIWFVNNYMLRRKQRECKRSGSIMTAGLLCRFRSCSGATLFYRRQLYFGLCCGLSGEKSQDFLNLFSDC